MPAWWSPPGIARQLALCMSLPGCIYMLLSGLVGTSRRQLALERVVDHRYVHTGLLARAAWELRHTVTFYDGLYIALAVRLDVPLLTADANLTKAPDLPCHYELVS